MALSEEIEILDMTPENILSYMEQKIQATRRPGTLFPIGHLAEIFNSPSPIIERVLESLEAQKKVHRVGKVNWGLGGNPWGGQRRQKIFRCTHCGQQNTVDITGD